MYTKKCFFKQSAKSINKTESMFVSVIYRFNTYNHQQQQCVVCVYILIQKEE